MNQNLVWFVLSAVVLAVLFVLWIMKRNRLRRARSWPIVLGTVTSSVVRVESYGERQSTLVAEVTYSYSLNGESAAGVLRRNFLIPGHADRWAGSYPVGSSVTIRYNPENSKDSVMDENDQSQSATPGTKAG